MYPTAVIKAAAAEASQAAWRAYDSTILVREVDKDKQLPLLVDQGEADGFLQEQLRPELLQQACDEAGYPVQINLHPGYDHSYFFIASFSGEHLRFHAAHLTG